MAGLEIEIRPIAPGDRLTGLSLGDAKFTALKTFVQRWAQLYHSQNLARTYGAFTRSGQAKLVGYVTLVCGEIAVGAEDGALVDAVGYTYRQYPAVKIARLAVDRALQGASLGRRLVDLTLGTAKDVVCPAVGCRFVVVDAKQDAVGFYRKCGFRMLDTQANRERPSPIMFVDLHKV